MKNKDFKAINDLIHQYGVHNSSGKTMVCDKALLVDFKKLKEAYEGECVETAVLKQRVYTLEVMVEDLIENGRHG